MFGIDSAELLLVAVVALVVIGPKELPRMLRIVGYWVGKARGTVRQFRAGIDDMIRESELQEMEKKWREENERIIQSTQNVALEGPAIHDPVIHGDEPLYPDNAADFHSSTPPIDTDATVSAEAAVAPELPFGAPASKDESKPDLP